MTAPAFVATDVQQQLMRTVQDGRYRYIGFGGGVRGTKTWGSLSVLLVLCKAFPGSRWAVIRKDLQRLRQTTLPSFEKLRQRTSNFCGSVDGYFEAKCTNGSVILFRGENIDKDPELERFHGYEVNGFLFEEADELQERTFHKAIERAGAWVVPKGLQPDPLILCTFNPNAAWPKRVFYDPWVEGTLNAPYAFIPTTIADNPHAPESYKESLKDLPPEEYKRFVEGDWTTLTGRYYTSLDRSVHLVKRETLPDPWPRWWEFWGSFDWGFAHWAVFCAWGRDSDGNTYLLDSCWMRREQDDDMARTIVATMPRECLAEVYAGGDCWGAPQARGGSGDSTADIFDAFRIVLIPADQDRVNGGRAVRRALAVRDGRSGVYLVETEGNLRIWDQLGQTMPDPNNPNKPEKVDADSQGRGGDDGCLSGDTRVITPDGARRIKELVGTEGLCLSPLGWQRYIAVRATRRNAQVVCVETDAGTVTGTPDHRVLTPTGWRALGDLCAGDEWCVVRPGSDKRDGADLRWAALLEECGRVLSPQPPLPSSRCVGLDSWPDRAGIADSPRGWQQGEQPSEQPGGADTEGACGGALDAGGSGGFGNAHPRLIAPLAAVASVAGGDRVASGEWPSVNTPTPREPSREAVRVLRGDLCDDMAEQDAFLSSELQATAAADRTGGARARVRSVTQAEPRDTYDLTVVGAACFVVEGGLVVHNSDAFRYGLSTKMLTPADGSEEEARKLARSKLDPLSRAEDKAWEASVKAMQKRSRVRR